MSKVKMNCINTNMQNELEKRNLTVIEFKKKYPRLYRKIINKYSNIFDKAAALCLYLRGESQPHCEICNAPLSIIERYRTSNLRYRCGKHAKSTLLSKQAIFQANVHGYQLHNVSEYMSTTDTLTVECSEHGQFTCQVSYFLDNHKCQRCYHDNQFGKFRVSENEWLTRSKAIHQDKYCYKKSKYTGTVNAVEIECPIHGIFVQNAGVHMRGHGCSKCSNEKNQQNLTFTAEEFIEKANLIHQNKYDYTKIVYSGGRNRVKIICPTHGEFEQVAYYHLAGNGCQKCGFEISTYKSSAEYEIIDFLKSLGVTNIVHSWWGMGTEIDIYLPDHNLAIEYDGIYWHSSNSIDTDNHMSRKHLKKTTLCEENGIQLFHILDLEWVDPVKQSIWKSVLSHKLGLTKNKVHARSTTVQIVDAKVAKLFFTNNHLQGYARSSINLALQFNGEIVAMGSFSKSRFTKNKDCWELVRYASLCNTSVVGGFSKLLSAFSKDNPGKIISYANRRWSTGKLYQSTGFALDHVSGPCYYYTDCGNLWHRTVFQKHKLKDQLSNFDPALTEVQNMYNHKYRRFWDCGNLVFVKE